jgi:putative membrane protein
MKFGLTTGRWRGLILFTWTAGLALLLGFGRYSLFIRPTLWPLILCNVLILLLFLVAMIVRPIHGGARPITAAGWVRGGMLLLPLAYMSILLSGAAASGLNSFALQKRSLGLGWASDSLAAPQGADTTAINTNQPISLGYIIRHAPHLTGSRVITEGRVSLDDRLPAGQFVIYRFVIVCCAADAIPVQAVIKSPRTAGFKSDDWIRVGGILRTEVQDGKTVPVIEADQIDSMPPPDEPYLSPAQF